MVAHRTVNKAPLIRLLLILGVFFLSVSFVSAQYDFNNRCRDAYRSIFSLRFQEAENILAIEKKINPSNLLPVYLENYIDFLTLYIGEERRAFDQLIPNKSIRIKKLEKGSRYSPYYAYSLAEIYLQWAFIRIKFGDFAQAALDIRNAHRLFAENDRKFPGFLPNKTGLGIIHILMGLVPENYQWVKDILGMKGTISLGLEELRLVGDYSGEDRAFLLLRPEASFYLAMIAANLLKNKTETLVLLNRLDEQAKAEQLGLSPLIIFARSNILLKYGKTDEALKILQTRLPQAKSYPFYYLDYLEGMARLNKLDVRAARFFQQYLVNFHGQNYLRAARQKLAWISLIKGDTLGYLHQMELIRTSGGALLVDEDKQALHEAEAKVIPGSSLLKARLLFDGGYYGDALKEITDHPVKSYIHTRRDFLEYTYRLGRIYHALGDHTKAVDAYKQTIQRGKNEPYYFSCSAALQLGLMYESQGHVVQADSAFRVCLSIDTPEYKTSLSQKAKAGLNRLKK